MNKNKTLTIIDGIDGTGKSTLAKKLSNGQGKRIVHATSETPNTFEWHIKVMNDKKIQVVDRFFIGEWVWSRIYNRKCKISDEQFETLVDICNSRDDIKVIFAYNNKWKEVLTSRGEQDQLPSREKAFSLYLEFFGKFGLKYELYNYVENEEKEEVEETPREYYWQYVGPG